MIIKDTKGMYEIRVDVARRVVYDTPVGLWKGEDMDRYQKDFETKVYPLIKNKVWIKCSDLRAYKTSSIVDETNNHLKWCVENGFIGGAIIIDSPVVKMQMNRAAKDTGLKLGPIAFTDLKEAEEWINSQDF